MTIVSLAHMTMVSTKSHKTHRRENQPRVFLFRIRGEGSANGKGCLVGLGRQKVPMVPRVKKTSMKGSMTAPNSHQRMADGRHEIRQQEA
jgi:hypothetical protein